ncbi:hypothetical protein [Ruminococcus sp.]|jgi:hypothetical protein|nr:hypothetical protein [Ruminococcus sp.]
MLRIRNTYNSKGEKLSRGAEINSRDLSGLLGEVVSRRRDRL